MNMESILRTFLPGIYLLHVLLSSDELRASPGAQSASDPSSLEHAKGAPNNLGMAGIAGKAFMREYWLFGHLLTSVRIT